MEKKNEYIDRLLQKLQSLEARVSAIKREESVPFSFFREAFQKGQEVMSLLHELEMLQIEDMKHQMEKLVLFLSESESRTSVEETRKNTYAQGIALPAYTNPRNVETKKEEVVPEEVPGVLRSVNDVIQTPPPKLDVKRGLSLNDRFYFQRELFDNDREAMNSVMTSLNAFDNYEEMERYLREKTSWNFKDERVKSFLELLKKGFE
ncbi:MAG TPA: hypothetical protein GXX42_07710 [Petrimonas sp.]|uniref:hypothetical protein n=1 Tax=Petrimonas sp. TaxID=2023866 RepID=UPI0009698B2D|nr:hypothetical protein [Petrimonas sp.]OJV35716.1 MAG: hypothetical protein BGO33_10660 [Bacteroidia bacterium 43-41]MEA4949988.1 hypothetical protein [Petrimonas sp.]MEA4978595.1 hypothetical protein [Petrimonas sp.]MEA5045005.1 hypothetical protein [Petrimonas sp.]